MADYQNIENECCNTKCDAYANKYYEKHPLLGAADRATLYAFVARKQPHE